MSKTFDPNSFIRMTRQDLINLVCVLKEENERLKKEIDANRNESLRRQMDAFISALKREFNYFSETVK